MKKVLLGLFALSAVSMASTFEDSYLNFRLGGDLGAKYSSLYTNDDVAPFSMASDTDGYGYEIATEFLIPSNENLNIGIGVAFQSHADRSSYDLFETDSSNISYEGLEYQSLPIYITAEYNLFKNCILNPYLKFDFGYSFNFGESRIHGSYDNSNNNNHRSGISETTIHDGMYYGMGVGIEYNNFTADLMYKINKATADIYSNRSGYQDLNAYNNLDVDADYERWVLTIGYRFNLK